MTKVAALIPAAGSGTRLGMGAKAFVEVGGVSLLERSISALYPFVDEVIIALPEDSDFKSTKAASIFGGKSRQESVYRLIESSAADVVVVHDAARPFLASSILKELLGRVAVTGAATVAMPLADTLVSSKGLEWDKLISRDGLWSVQTPQGFNRELLLRAHVKAAQEGFVATDDASLVARMGVGVSLVCGDARLFKVTTPSDLALAEALAQVWHG